MLAYLSRYTHRVAISNNRLISADAEAVTFRWKDYGLLAGAGRKANVAKIRKLLGAEAPSQTEAPSAEITPLTLREPCPDCGSPMRIVEIFRRGQQPRSRAPPREQAA